jgi:hypothetical protein
MQRLRLHHTVHLGSHRHIPLNGVSARSNAIHYYARRSVVERQQSAEPPALSGRCQDLSPCSKALGWPRDQWSCRRQGCPSQLRSPACRPRGRGQLRRRYWIAMYGVCVSWSCAPSRRTRPRSCSTATGGQHGSRPARCERTASAQSASPVCGGSRPAAVADLDRPARVRARP